MEKIWAFLSAILNEKILRLPAPDKLVADIERRVNEYNQKSYNQVHCYSCGGKKFIRRITGSNGLFSFQSHIYECTACHNQQNTDGSSRLNEFTEMRKARIIGNNGRYRYSLWPSAETEFKATLFLILVAGFTPFFLMILGKLLKWGPFAFMF